MEKKLTARIDGKNMYSTSHKSSVPQTAGSQSYYRYGDRPSTQLLGHSAIDKKLRCLAIVTLTALDDTSLSMLAGCILVVPLSGAASYIFHSARTVEIAVKTQLEGSCKLNQISPRT